MKLSTHHIVTSVITGENITLAEFINDLPDTKVFNYVGGDAFIFTAWLVKKLQELSIEKRIGDSEQAFESITLTVVPHTNDQIARVELELEDTAVDRDINYSWPIPHFDTESGKQPRPTNIQTFSSYEGEPVFILLGRDPAAAILVELWSEMRAVLDDPKSWKVRDSLDISRLMHNWKRANPTIGLEAPELELFHTNALANIFNLFIGSLRTNTNFARLMADVMPVLFDYCRVRGVVIDVQTVSQQPPSMGNYGYQFNIRESFDYRKRREQAEADARS